MTRDQYLEICPVMDRMCRATARRMGVNVEDLLSAARVIVVEAAERFDETKENKTTGSGTALVRYLSRCLRLGLYHEAVRLRMPVHTPRNHPIPEGLSLNSSVECERDSFVSRLWCPSEEVLDQLRLARAVHRAVEQATPGDARTRASLLSEGSIRSVDLSRATNRSTNYWAHRNRMARRALREILKEERKRLSA